MRKNIKMRWLSRMLALALALVITAMPVNAKAAGDTYNVTVENAVSGKTYNIYKLFDATSDGNDAVAYTITETAANADWIGALQSDDSPFTLISAAGETTHNVVRKVTDAETGATVTDDAIIEWLKSAEIRAIIEAATTSYDPQPEESNPTVVKWTGVAEGYYYISTGIDALATIDSVTGDLTIVDKNQKPSWDPEDPENPSKGNGKFVLEDGSYEKSSYAGIGDEIDYKVNVYAPKYDGTDEIVKYVFVDTLPENGIDYVGNFEMYIDGVKVTDTSLYTAFYKESTKQLIIEYNIDAIEEAGVTYSADAHVKFFYKAKLTDTAVAVNTNVITMQWYTDADPDDPENPLTPGNPNTPGNPGNPGNPDDPDDPYIPEDPETPETPDKPVVVKESKTDTYTFGVNVLKKDGATLESLTGAQFTLAKESAADLIKFLVVDNVYRVSADQNADGTVTILDTDADGKIAIFGLDLGKYDLTETKAPDGYNKLTEAKVVTIASSGADDEYYFEVEVLNNAGTLLPSTGGIGTTIFYVVGGLLVVVAGVLLVTKKRMKDAE